MRLRAQVLSEKERELVHAESQRILAAPVEDHLPDSVSAALDAILAAADEDLSPS